MMIRLCKMYACVKWIFDIHPNKLMLKWHFSHLITLCPTLAPAQQGVSSGATMSPQQSTETILRSER